MSLLADCSGSAGSRTAEASRSRVLALGAGRHHGLVRMGRVSQPRAYAANDCRARHLVIRIDLNVGKVNDSTSHHRTADHGAAPRRNWMTVHVLL